MLQYRTPPDNMAKHLECQDELYICLDFICQLPQRQQQLLVMICKHTLHIELFGLDLDSRVEKVWGDPANCGRVSQQNQYLVLVSSFE